MRMQTPSLSIAILFTLATLTVAQEDIQPLIDRDDPATNTAPSEGPEDIPPPRPVPTQPQSVLSTDKPVEQNAAPARRAIPDASGEIHAYDFGVSVLPVDSGLRVRGVIVGSPAQAAGVRPNDIILEVNGQAAGNGDSLMQKVESVSISRAGDARTLTVDNTRQAESRAVPAPQAADSSTVRRTYSVPRTTYSAPQSYRYAPRYNSSSNYSRYYRSSPYSYRSGYGATYYRSRPSVSVGIGVGTGGFYGPGFYGPGRGFYGPGRGFYGPGLYGPGRGFYGPSFYGRGRSGVGISIGGIGIRF